MLKYTWLLVVLILVGLANGCATITRGSSDVLVVNSDPLGAKVTTSTGLSGKTPATFKVNRRGGFVVKIEKQGFEPVEVQISSKIHGAGGTALAGNILLGGLIGAAVDAGTGAAYDVVPNPVNVKLVPLSASASTEVNPRTAPLAPPTGMTIGARADDVNSHTNISADKPAPSPPD